MCPSLRIFSGSLFEMSIMKIICCSLRWKFKFPDHYLNLQRINRLFGWNGGEIKPAFEHRAALSTNTGETGQIEVRPWNLCASAGLRNKLNYGSPASRSVDSTSVQLNAKLWRWSEKRVPVYAQSCRLTTLAHTEETNAAPACTTQWETVFHFHLSALTAFTDGVLWVAMTILPQRIVTVWQNCLTAGHHVIQFFLLTPPFLLLTPTEWMSGLKTH